MTSQELRKQFLDFFASLGHKIVSSSPLLDKTDPSVLLTTAGMQQFKPYFSGKKNPEKELGSRRIETIQKCFRTSDIDTVGDKDHLTFLEMLGSFSFGDYWKREAILWAFEFLNQKLKISQDRIRITVFEGDKEVPFDKESYQIWLKLGFSPKAICKAGRKDNFWGPTGNEGPCGPTTEIYVDGIEVWNLVFNEYYFTHEGKLKSLEIKGIDTGMGLERLAMVSQQKQSVFETDLFTPIIQSLRESGYELTKDNIRRERILADHLRGAVFLISEKLLPSNVKEGYVLRRVLRRAIRFVDQLALKEDGLNKVLKEIIGTYQSFYPEIKLQENEILLIIQKENEVFRKALSRGLKELEKMIAKDKDLAVFSGKDAFQLYESYGFPLELTKEILAEKNIQVDSAGFEKAKTDHQSLSRIGIEKKIGGLRQNPSYYETKLHTATHLLHQALRDVLGQKVKQMGSDIDLKRLRFDFSFNRGLTQEELDKIVKIINQKIRNDLIIKKEKVSYEKAIKMGVLSFFKEKYPSRVSVYTIGSSEDQKSFYSREICAGPHVSRTSELKNFVILKEEGVGAGIRRIRAKVEK